MSTLNVRVGFVGTPLEGNELPLSFLREYDGAAEHFARSGTLPANMGSPGALDYINADPEAFQERVRQFQYGIAMGDEPKEVCESCLEDVEDCTCE